MFEHYQLKRNSGKAPKEVAAEAINDGLAFPDILRMLCTAFGLSFVQAKEAWIQAQGHESLAQYQGTLIPDEEALAEMEKIEREMTSE